MGTIAYRSSGIPGRKRCQFRERSQADDSRNGHLAMVILGEIWYYCGRGFFVPARWIVMAPPIAAEPFWELLRKSGIVPTEDAQLLQRELQEQQAGLDSGTKIANELVTRKVLTKWQAGMLLKGRHRGFFLGPYRIQGMLGEGGMGTVFLAEHQMMRRLCAIKVLPPKHSQDNPSLIKRFYREAQAVAALDHPNIVRAYDVNKAMLNETEVHYLVMEYVEGKDLQKLVDSQGVLGYRDAAKFMRQAAEGLLHAHERGFVHRDVKPANLLVDLSGTVKILDLGLARFFDPASDESLSGEHGEIVLGTADYLAPEQAINSHTVDARADIYSLGQTGYFLLTGHAPFPTGTIAERLMAHQVKSPEPIDRERPDAPPALLAIIERMIAKKPESRYQSAKEVAETLGEWLNRETKGDDLKGFAARFQKHLRPASNEPTRSVAASTVETDLELVPLEDEEKAPTAGDKSATSGSKAPSASGGKPASKSDARKTPVPKSKSGSGDPATKDAASLLDDLESLPPQADLSALASEPASSGVHPVAPVGQQFLRPKRKSGLEAATSSPLFWIGLAAVPVVLLIIVIVIASSSSEAPTPSPPAMPAPTEPEQPPDTTPTLPPVVAPPKPTTEVPQTTSPSAGPERTTTSDGQATVVPKPSGDKPKIVPPKPPKDGRNTQPRKPARRTPEKPEPVDANALFAGVSEYSVELKSFDRNRQSKLHALVSRKMEESAKRADLTIGKTKAAVMTIDLSAPEEGDKVRLIISGTLECRDPADAKARAVTVWQHEQELGVVSKHVLERSGVPVLIIRSNVGKFFARFASDYDKAQTAAKKRPIP